MGTLPLMALLPGVRPILVATPRVLVPKGVQVHRQIASSHWSPGIRRPTNRACPVNGHHRPPPATCPMDKKTYLTDRACPVTGHRAFPSLATSHRAFTDHRPETSSLPITRHQPSSHRSLDSERLNTGEIQESPTTGHDWSPGSRPPVTGHQNIIQPTTSESHTLGTEFTSKQPSTSRVLLPLEPDFRNMSDNNNNYGQIHQTSLSGWRSRRDQSRNKHRSKKRRRQRSASTSSTSTSTSIDSRKRKSKRSKYSQKKRRR